VGRGVQFDCFDDDIDYLFDGIDGTFICFYRLNELLVENNQATPRGVKIKILRYIPNSLSCCLHSMLYCFTVHIISLLMKQQIQSNCLLKLTLLRIDEMVTQPDRSSSSLSRWPCYTRAPANLASCHLFKSSQYLIDTCISLKTVRI
jgi:hypothetical protein